MATPNYGIFGKRPMTRRQAVQPQLNAPAPAGSLEAARDAMFSGQQQRLQQGTQFYANQPQAPVRQSALSGFNQPNPARARADAMLSRPIGIARPGATGPYEQPIPIARPGNPAGPPEVQLGRVDQGVWGPGGRQYAGLGQPIPAVPRSGARLNSAANVGLTPDQRQSGLAASPNFTGSPDFTPGAVPQMQGIYRGPHTRNQLNVNTLPNGNVQVVGPTHNPFMPADRKIGNEKAQQRKDFRVLSRSKLNSLDPRYAPAVWQAAQRQGITLPQMLSRGGSSPGGGPRDLSRYRGAGSGGTPSTTDPGPAGLSPFSSGPQMQWTSPDAPPDMPPMNSPNWRRTGPSAQNGGLFRDRRGDMADLLRSLGILPQRRASR